MKKAIKVGNVTIGGGAPVSVQSMTNTDTADIASTTEQVAALSAAGCDIVRIAVSSEKEAETSKAVIKASDVPLVADIQFDYRLAIACADIGFNKIRFNPGNIGGKQKVKELVAACKANGVPIRIGVNGGSLEKEILGKYGNSAEGLAESALGHIKILEECGFDDIIVSVKSSNVRIMTEANKILDKKFDYTLHIGVTESGSYENWLLKISVGIGSLLLNGIGDTIRVSLSGDPIQEVVAARRILRSVGKDENYCEIVSCPTCSRCKYDMMSVLDKVTKLTENVNKRMKIAVMGCVVNGPGEAKDADLGVAGGKDKAVIFKKGEVIATVKHEEIIPYMERMILDLTKDG